MTLRPWIASMAAVSTLTIAGVALAQQPPSQAQDVKDRGTGVSMTNPNDTQGKPITVSNLPTVDRWQGTSMTNPIGSDGKPLTQSTNFGSR